MFVIALVVIVIIALVLAYKSFHFHDDFHESFADDLVVPEACGSRCSKCMSCRARTSDNGSASGNAPSNALPPPSSVADGRCKTHMGDDPDDDGTCLALVYHECPEYGRTDESMIPSWIRDMKQSALNQIYELNIDCTSEEGADKTPVPRYKCFTRPPQTWASVCVARPEKAGKGKCRSMRPDEWRVFVQGEDPLRTITCAGLKTPASLYLKSHFNGTRINESKTGKVGRA